MKLLWFHLMPYPELPEDFASKYRGVWVDLDSALLDPAVAADAYEEYLDQLIFAEQCGFDGMCVNEHHSNGYGLMPSPNLMAAVVAQRTSRAAVVVLGNSVALYDPPTRVAEEMAMLDLLSRGRFVAGFPVGTPMDTAYAYGANPGTLRAKYREGIDLILRAWTEREPFAFNGRFTKQRWVNIWPRPMQQPHPPVWIPGGGSVETWDMCAENNWVYAALSYYGHKLGKETMDGFWNRVEAHGLDDNPYRAGFLQFVGVADTDAEAYRLYKEPAEYFFHRCLHFYPGFVDPPGYTTEATVRVKAKSAVRAAATARQAGGGPTFDEMLELGYVIIGSPETVRDKIVDIAHNLRVGHLMVLLHFGNMADDVAKQNTKLFGEKVLPHLRDVWPGYEDHWWPANAQ